MIEKIIGLVLEGRTPPIVFIVLLNVTLIIGVYDMLSDYKEATEELEQATENRIRALEDEMIRIDARFKLNEVFIFKDEKITR